MASIDNAIVNVPLSKRGNIDAQITKHLKAEHARAEAASKALRATKRQQMAQVKALIAAVSDERMAELGKPYGLTVKQTRSKFVAAAFSNPDVVIKTMTAEVEKQQAEAERIAYVSAERAERLAECEERAARQKTRAYAAEWSEPGPDPLSPDKRAALNGALAQIDRAFGKGAVVPASRMEAA